MEKLAQKNREMVVDVLGERLGVERTAVKLYDGVIVRMHRSVPASDGPRRDGDGSRYGLGGHGDDAAGETSEDIARAQGRSDRGVRPEARVIAGMLPQIAACREQEKEHQQWLEASIRQLGADPGRPTELARLAARETSGIEAVIAKDPEFPHLLHALLAAEHVDGAGWELLVALAEEAGDGEAREQFEKRRREEEQHLVLLREALRMFSAHRVLDEDLTWPVAGA